MIYVTLGEFIIKCCSTAWGSLNITNLQKVQKTHFYNTRSINNEKINVPKIHKLLVKNLFNLFTNQIR